MAVSMLTIGCKKKEDSSSYYCTCTYQMPPNKASTNGDYVFKDMSSSEAAEACKKRAISFQTPPYAYGSCKIK